jgi:imidazolonepropionase-like amidohydrolase
MEAPVRLPQFSSTFCALTILALTGSTPAAPLTAQTAPLVIRNVNVVPMDSEEVLAGQTVVIRDGRIESVGPAPVELPANATIIDGTGRYVIPGLAEMHAHVSGAQLNPRILTLFAVNGVTTARGMLGQPAHLALRDSLARGLVLGPRLITSGPSFSGPNVTPEDAARRVREQKEAGYDLLKIHPGLTRETFDALARTADEVGIPFAGHVPVAVGLDRAIEAGYRTIDHLDAFMDALLAPGAPVTPAQGGWFGLNLMPHIDTARIAGMVDRVAAAGVAMVPTQTLMEHFSNDLTGDELAARPEFRYWPTEQVQAWRNQKNAFLSNAETPDAAQRACYTQVRRQLIRALHDGGVEILLGSDAPQIWNVPGFAAHRELQLYVAAGLTPYEALRTGTVNIARHLNEEGESGVVRAGARADLVLLDANPLDNIENTQRIAGVVVNGRWISSAERDRLLAGLRVGG